MSRNFETHSCQRYVVKRIKPIFTDLRGIVEQGLGQLFITSSNSHFFNTIDLELYLLQTESRKEQPERRLVLSLEA